MQRSTSWSDAQKLTAFCFSHAQLTFSGAMWTTFITYCGAVRTEPSLRVVIRFVSQETHSIFPAFRVKTPESELMNCRPHICDLTISQSLLVDRHACAEIDDYISILINERLVKIAFSALVIKYKAWNPAIGWNFLNIRQSPTSPGNSTTLKFYHRKGST